MHRRDFSAEPFTFALLEKLWIYSDGCNGMVSA